MVLSVYLEGGLDLCCCVVFMVMFRFRFCLVIDTEPMWVFMH